MVNFKIPFCSLVVVREHGLEWASEACVNADIVSPSFFLILQLNSLMSLLPDGKFFSFFAYEIDFFQILKNSVAEKNWEIYFKKPKYFSDYS